MELAEAIALLKKTVKQAGTIDQKHLDLGLIPAEERSRYEKALIVSQLAIKDGKITRDEFNRKVNLES